MVTSRCGVLRFEKSNVRGSVPRVVCVPRVAERLQLTIAGGMSAEGVPFLDSDDKRHGSAVPSPDNDFLNKVLARQQARFVKSPFQTGVRGLMSTLDVQGGSTIYGIAAATLGFVDGRFRTTTGDLSGSSHSVGTTNDIRRRSMALN